LTVREDAMAAKTAVNVASVSVRGTLGGQLIETGLFYLFDAAIDDTALSALLASLATGVIAHWLPSLGANYIGREIYGYDMTPGATLQATDTGIAGMSGGLTGGAQANNVTIAVARKTGRRGRSTQGRIYWPTLVGAQLESTTEISAGAAADIVAALEAVDGLAELLSWTPVTLSFQTDHVVSPAAVITHILEWVVTDLRVDSQLRRLEGRGV
jgi:hypothetical protein